MDPLLKYKIGLSLLPGVGSINAKKLIAYTGSVDAVFLEKKHVLEKIPGIGSVIAKKISTASVLEMAESEIEKIEKNNIVPLFYLDENYPGRLTHLSDAPIVLYVKGEFVFNAEKSISIVGTRKATQYGLQKCEELVEQLAERGHNPLVVSGLAMGIDVCAHKAAIKNKLKTVGVLGHGLGMVYPSGHKNIAASIMQQGGLVSEFLYSEEPEPSHFVKRNRIIAGLSDVTIVVESGTRGGALITADLAASYHRDVFAIPGRVGDTCSAGCNKLIKTNKAALLENVNDLEYLMGWEKDDRKKVIQRELFTAFSDGEKKIYDIVRQNGDINIDIISAYAEMPVSKVSTILLSLEFSGSVKCLPGKVYRVV